LADRGKLTVKTITGALGGGVVLVATDGLGRPGLAADRVLVEDLGQWIEAVAYGELGQEIGEAVDGLGLRIGAEPSVIGELAEKCEPRFPEFQPPVWAPVTTRSEPASWAKSEPSPPAEQDLLCVPDQRPS
jgi:hypothetical protein